MPKLEWGKKHICSDCNTKFYDMSKSTPECPNCGSQVLITRKPRVGRPPLSQKKPEPAVKIIEDIEDIENTEETGEIENIKEDEDADEMENNSDSSIPNNIKPDNG